MKSAARTDLSPRTARLADLLADTRRKTATLTDLYDLWALADPAGAGRPDRRLALSEAIDELTEADVLRPSTTTDKSEAPYLPTRVTMLDERPELKATSAAIADTIWRPELAWVYQARIHPRHIDPLKRINTWLRDRGHEGDHIPIRERSLEILGNEKQLDGLLNTALFGKDRLTLSLLRTFRTSPPLAGQRIGDGPVLLVVENDNTYHSAKTVLEQVARGTTPIGYVAWGAGGGFEASVRSTADLAIQTVRYFGDIDPDGLRIPGNAAATASRENLPPVQPAGLLYRRLLDTGVRLKTRAIPPERARDLANWLADPVLVDEVADLLSSGLRVPQEALNLTSFEAIRDWGSRG